jgi:phage recombination protein Bet
MNENTNLTITQAVNQEASTFYRDIGKGSAVLREKLFGKLDDKSMFTAIIEAHALGYRAQDFLSKKVYAIPYGNSYSLVTSIDDARSNAAATGDYAGSTGGEFTYKDNGRIETCSVTVKKFVKGTICDFTATVHFDEYDGKRNLWASKPHTMIAKVAEMHALRKAFPDTVKLYDVAEMPASSTIKVESSQDIKFETDPVLDVKDEEPVMTIEELPEEEKPLDFDNI